MKGWSCQGTGTTRRVPGTTLRDQMGEGEKEVGTGRSQLGRESERQMERLKRKEGEQRAPA